MKTIMNVNKLTSVEELEQFLAGAQPVVFSVEGKTQAISMDPDNPYKVSL